MIPNLSIYYLYIRYLYNHAIIISIRIFGKYKINKVMNLYNYNSEKSIILKTYKNKKNTLIFIFK